MKAKCFVNMSANCPIGGLERIDLPAQHGPTNPFPLLSGTNATYRIEV